MNCKIPFTKDIDFGKKVTEITSISLEHEIEVVNNTLKGNFIVSGEFKSHEVSVNKESFSYVLPFEIDLLEDIDTDTVEFMIDDFTYEIIEQNSLRVNIDFNVVASKKEEIKEEPLFQDAKEAIRSLDEKLEETEEENLEENDNMKEEVKEEVKEEPEVKEERTEKTLKETEDTIINTINNTEEEYTTYHIHMVSDGETVETICTMYQSNIQILGEYNDLTDVMPGDKLIIPEKNE